MRFIKNTPNKAESESLSSSIRSVDSYGIFGSAPSDFSDCECAEDRRQYTHNKSYLSLATGSPSSCCSVMRTETTPLLAPAYKTITSGSTSDSLGPADLSAREILATYKRTFEKSIKPEKKKQSSLVTIFSVWNTIMGSSLLAMAWGVQRAGLAAALLLLAVMAALCLYTAYLLLRVNHYHGGPGCEVPALCRALLGRGAAAAAHACSLLVLLGATVVYWVLMANFLYYTVNYLVDLQSNSTEYNTTLLCPSYEPIIGTPEVPEPAPSPYWGLHTTVPFYVALIIFPILNFRNVSFFTKFNSLGTLSVLYLVAFVVWKGAAWGAHVAWRAESYARADAAALSGMLALSFYIHNIIITIMGNNARQENNGRDLTIAFVLVTITYTLVGAVFYICFPLAKSCIADNILNNFEMHDVMTAVARALLLFQVVTVYPLVAYMLRSQAILLLPFKETAWLRAAINVIIVAVCILVACLWPNVGTIIRYTGALSGVVHVFVLPAALRARSLALRRRLAPRSAVGLAALAAAGLANLALQFSVH